MNRQRLFTLLAGAPDLLTGWGLILVPDTVQELMLVSDPLPSPAVRIVGAFVAGVGATYVWSAFRPGPGERRLWNTLSMTAVLRCHVGLVFLILVVARQLGIAWLTVALTDLILALVQILWWRNWRRSQT